MLACSLKKSVYIMPNSFGPFEGPFVKSLVRLVLKKCTFVSSRETYSQMMVENKLGLKIDNYPDLAFYLENAVLNKKEVFEEYNLPFDKKLVAITMRPHRFPKSKTPKEDYMVFKEEMALFMRWLYNSGFMPVVIEHTLAVNSHENDGACIKDVISMLNENEYRLISNKNYNCYQLKSIYGYCNYIIGTRFHSVIFSLANCVPGIAITYAGNKGQGIMHDIGLDNLSISIENVKCNILKEKFEYILDNEEEIIIKIVDYNKAALKERDSLIRKIQECTK